MSDQPWFKFYAADYLLDPDVDAMPREAEALLLRMWCICAREGSCPVDVETLARKTQCGQEYVSQVLPSCQPFFELRQGKLYSRRMEDEKRRSEQARENANKRYGKKTAVPTAVQTAVPRSDSDSNSGLNGVGSGLALLENARPREVPICEDCGGLKRVHVGPTVKGSRLIPCPKCCGSQSQTIGASA
jgi:uncharacterized protein YdaU (DUF1376 family)